MQDQPGSVIDALARALVRTAVVDAATRDPMSEANSLIAEIASQHGIYGPESYAVPLYPLLPGLQNERSTPAAWHAREHPSSQSPADFAAEAEECEHFATQRIAAWLALPSKEGSPDDQASALLRYLRNSGFDIEYRRDSVDLGIDLRAHPATFTGGGSMEGAMPLEVHEHTPDPEDCCGRCTSCGQAVEPMPFHPLAGSANLRRPDWDSLTPDQKVQARLDGTEYREPTLEERVAAVEARLAALESRPSPYDVIGDQMSPGR